MDPKIVQAMQAIASALAGGHPAEAAEIQKWVASGGKYALPVSVLTLALPLAPTVGVPAAAILAAIRGTGDNPPPPTATGNASQVMADLPTATGADRALQPPPQTTGPFSPDRGQPVGGPPQNPTAAPFSPDRGRPVGGPTPAQTAAANPPQQTPVAGPGDKGGEVPGGFSAEYADNLAGNDNLLLRFAMRAAGFNPNVLTPATKIAMQKLGALVAARRAAFGAGSPDQNVSGLPQDIASFAKEYSSPGQDFYGHARQYAQQLMGGQNFQDYLSGIADPMKQYQMYEALVPLLFGGANPMIQQSVSDQFKNLQNDYEDADAQTPGGVQDILQFIRNQPNLSPGLRSIFGPVR